MTVEYVDTQHASAHAAFQAWRTQHPSGVFLSFVTRTRAFLHGARCTHLGSGPPYFQLEDGLGSLTKNRKICGEESELLAWARVKHVTVKHCQQCVRDHLIVEAVSDDVPASASSDDASFKQADFFPVVARLIVGASMGQDRMFIAHDDLVDCVLGDEVGVAMVRGARAKSSWPDDRGAASNMVAWFSQQITVGRSEWTHFFNRERVGETWAYRPVATATPGAIAESDSSAIEGEPRMFFHLRRERDPNLVRAKRAAAQDGSGNLRCEVCGFLPEDAYPGWSHGFLCEVHHRRPLGEAVGNVNTRLEDLSILCPNCHRAIHRTCPRMSVEEFRDRFGTGQSNNPTVGHGQPPAG